MTTAGLVSATLIGLANAALELVGAKVSGGDGRRADPGNDAGHVRGGPPGRDSCVLGGADPRSRGRRQRSSWCSPPQCSSFSRPTPCAVWTRPSVTGSRTPSHGARHRLDGLVGDSRLGEACGGCADPLHLREVADLARRPEPRCSRGRDRGSSRGNGLDLGRPKPERRRRAALLTRPDGSARPDPLDPRRCEPSRWVSTMPIASISAYIVVGPRRRTRACSALDSATRLRRAGRHVGVGRAGAGVSAGRNDQTKSRGRRPRAARSWPGRW